MILTILAQKYKCGCNKGISAVEEPGILFKLNSIIKWDRCSWPKNLKEESKDKKPTEITDEDYIEETDFLGKDPELKPGNCFLWKGQIIAVDSMDKLVLIVTETGPSAITRFVDLVLLEDKISVENYIDWFSDVSVSKVSSEKELLDYNNLKSSLSQTPVDYNALFCMIEEHANDIPEECSILKATVDSSMLIFPLDIYINVDKKIVEIESDLVGEDDDEFENTINKLVNKTIEWIYQKPLVL